MENLENLKKEMIDCFEWIIKNINKKQYESSNYGICTLIGMYYEKLYNDLEDYIFYFNELELPEEKANYILELLEPEFQSLNNYERFIYYHSAYKKVSEGKGVFHFESREERIEFLEGIIEKIKNNKFNFNIYK